MFSIIIPIYNEADNILPLILEIQESVSKQDNYEVILVNDCSNDNTSDIIKKINSRFVKIVSNSVRSGQSKSIRNGILKSSFNTIVTMDGDRQNNPKDIPKLLELYKSKNKDCLVSGIRINRKDSLLKIVSSKIANYVRGKIFKDGCKDTGCSLKVFDKKIFLNFPFFNGIHRFLPSLFVGYNYDVYYLLVDHRKREKGKSNYGTFDRLYRGIVDIYKVRKIIKEFRDQNAKL